MRTGRSEGFTLVETLVAMALFSVLAAGFYTVMFSQVRGSERTRSVARIAEEGRLGFNRMIRDTREGTSLSASDGCTAADMQAGNCYNVKVDFDGDGVFENPNGDGDYENVTYSYNSVDDTIDIIVCNGAACLEEVLIDGVELSADGSDVFSFSSNLLRHDADGNGVTEWEELDQDPVVGDNDGLDDNEWPFLTNVSYSFRISGERAGEATEFDSEAQLRNLRFGG